MQPKRKQTVRPGTRKIVPIDRETSLVWKGPEYPILSPGIYTVGGIKTQGPEWVRSFHRWSLRVEFGLVAEPVSVSAFFNFGSSPMAPKVGRQSRYYKAWVLANGGHPMKGQQMSPDVFLEGQFFEVEIADCNRDDEGKPKADAEVYSRVIRVIAATRP
jgi:hypothetical protein